MGDVLEEWKQEGHLTERQYLAGRVLLAILQRCHGSSDGIVGQLLDKVDGSTRCPDWPPGSGADVAELERLLKGLRRHEREFMRHLVVHRERPRGTVADWGSVKSSYRTNKTRRAFTVGRGTGFLDSVAELCLPPVPS